MEKPPEQWKKSISMKKKWKIQTNITNFTTIPIAQRTDKELSNNKLVGLKSKRNLLGLTCGKFGYL